MLADSKAVPGIIKDVKVLNFLKRFFDIVCSALALIVFSPVIGIIALVVYIDDGSPVFFRQDRVGTGNKLFKIRKFRTMKVGTRTAATAELVESDSQITKSGKFLRKTSLDELPQLINIFEGTMSFVGPRPLIPEESEIRRLREEYGVYTVRPGVTGWAQINGRDNISIEEKANLDKEYIEKHSLWFDFMILLKTVVVVLKRENISEGSETGKKRKRH